MAEEAEVQGEAPPEAEPPKIEAEEEPKKSTYLDLDDIPEEYREPIKERLDDLTSKWRFAERDKEALQQWNAKLDEKYSRLESRLGSVEEKETGDRLAQLREAKIQAMEDMEYARAEEIDEQIEELKDARKAPKQEESDPQLEAFVHGWQSEINEDGEPLRPWAMPSHPDHKKAVGEAIAMTNDPVFMRDVTDAQSFLRKFDAHYAGLSKPKAQEVLSGNSSIRPDDNKRVELNAAQKEVARKMGIPEDRYAKQLKTLGMV
jgi:hypothetical protein